MLKVKCGLNNAEQDDTEDIKLLERHQRCLKKRIRTDCETNQLEGVALKKMKMSSTDHQSMEVKQDTTVSELDEPITYSAAELKRNFHGDIYQLKLLMLFLKQALNNQYAFGLATEVKEAGKFNVLIFQYENKAKNGMIYRFLQAKHIQTKNKKITARDLLQNTDKKLCLQDYFISYREIKRDLKTNDEIKDFIICTNIDMDHELEATFDPVAIEDDILDVVKEKSENAKFLKLKPESYLRNESLRFQETSSDLNRLTEKLAKHVLNYGNNNNQIDLKDKLFKRYHGALADKVIDVKTEKIKTDFINNSSYLSEEVKKFRKVLFQKCNLSSEANFKNQLKTTKIKTTDNFGNVFKLEKVPKIISKTPNPIQTLAKSIVDSIYNKKPNDIYIKIELRDFIIKNNIAKLGGHVFIKPGDDAITLRQGFLDGDTLPGDLNQFREEFKTELCGRYKGIQFSQLGQCKFKIDIPICSENDYKMYNKDKLYFEQFLLLPNDDVELEEIKIFLDALLFAVNQPNEGDLDHIIKNLIGMEFHLVNPELIHNYFLVRMQNWMAEKEVSFLTHKTGQKIFGEAKQYISTLKLLGNTQEYLTMIEGFGITFSEVPKELQTFLNSNDKQIFNLNSSHQTILGSIKVYQTLKDLPEYHKSDSYSFICLSSLLHIQTSAIEAFGSEATNNLLVIECEAAQESIRDAGIIQELYDKLYEKIQSNSFKKIILITKGNNALAEKFKHEFFRNDKYEETKDENSFTSLAPKSQKILLRKRQIIFQEKKITLEKLMKIKDVNDLSKDELDYLDKIIDQEALIQLIRKKNINVGIKRPHLSDLESIHYVASVTINEEQLLRVVRNNPSDVFVIAGTTKDEFSTKLNAKEKDAVRVLREDDARKGDKIIILSSKYKEENLNDFKRICSSDYSDFEDDVLSAHLIETENSVLIWKRSYDTTFYTLRNLLHVVMQKDSLQAHIAMKPEKVTGKKDIFAISSISIREFQKQYGIIISENENISTEDDSNKKNHVIILEDENEEERFENLWSKKRLEYYNIHWLQQKGDKLVWKRSLGEINKISEMQETTSNTTQPVTISDDDLYKFTETERVVVIAGEPGMGKSTTLTHLLKHADEHEWIIKLNLVDLQGKLKELKERGENYLDGIIENFFSKVGIGVNGKLAEELLKYRIERQGKITLLFDGFDEVAEENQNAVVKLLRYLKSTKAKIWITTRLHLKEKLENELSVLSYTFEPLSEKSNQIEFLQKFYKASFKLTLGDKTNNDTLDRNIEALLEGFYRNINDTEYEFLSIPLLMRMFAEIYQNTVEDWCRSDGTVEQQVLKKVKELSVLDLYEKFIETKYEIYFKEKLKNETIPNYVKNKFTKSINKHHQRLAFQKLFSKNELMKILGNESILHSQDEENYLKSIRIIQSINCKGDTYFIHQSFAEYFAAGLLVDRIKKRKDNPKYKLAREFLLRHLFLDRNEAIRVFFVNMIQKEHDDNLNSEWETIRDCDLLGQIETKGLLSLNWSSVEDPSIGTGVRHDAESGKSLAELKPDVESCMNYYQNAYGNMGGYYNNNYVELINILFHQFMKETDFKSLRITLEFLIKAYVKDCNEVTRQIFSRNNNIYNATKHFLTQAEQQNELHNASVMEVFSPIPKFETLKRHLIKFYSSTELNEKEVHAKQLFDFLTQGKPQNEKLLFCVSKVVGPDIVPYVFKFIEIYISDMTIADHIFHEDNIIKNLKNFKILTRKMSKRFRSKLGAHCDNDGWVSLFCKCYVSAIFKYVIIPIIDIIMWKEEHDVNELAFLKLLTYFTRFSVEHDISLSFTTHQLNTTLELIEDLLKHHNPVQEVLVESTDYLFALGKAGLKLINADQELLVLDPGSDFQYKLSTYRDEIVEGIRGKL